MNQTSLYQPDIGYCLRIITQIPTFPIILWITVVVIIITSIYFRYKIYKSNKFFNSVHTTAEQRQKAITAGKLLEKLHKELSSTVSVLIVGGIDGLLNLLVPLIWLGVEFVFTQNLLAKLVYTRMLLHLVQILQSLSHPLTYGIYSKDIRECIYKYKDRYFPKRSKVIVLNREAISRL